MSRLDAHADTTLWVPVTGSFGFRGRRHRKAAIRMLLTQANSAMGATERPGSSVAAWAASQAAPLLMRRMAGRMLAWVWRADPELGVVIAQLQEATPQVRAARAMMPMEFDDTEDFRSPHLGTGEKLELPFGAPSPMDPERRGSPTATYTWDTGTHLVTVSAMSPDRERFGIFVSAVDDLVRTLRIVDDLPAGETPGMLRIDPA